ncbi:MAG: mechanosensitive ion channel [Bacteroidales bacterium]|nr:mechanosensitive ion channel [Bacteroidales bacterium]
MALSQLSIIPQESTGFFIRLSLKLRDVLINDWGLSEGLAKWLHVLVFIILIALVSWLVDKATKQIIIRVIRGVVKKTKNQYDDIILEKGVFNRLAHISPALVVYSMLPTIMMDFQKSAELFQSLALVYMILVAIMVIVSFFNALNEIYLRQGNAHKVPIKGYIQVVQIVLILIGIIWAMSVLFGFELGKFFAGLGAFAAVLMLIFKDTILGVVASIQISANKMMSLGDWVSMPSRNADGTVVDISVNTVKIQNWDKTIATIPTYAFVTESFDNWKGMEDSGGRRIKRSVNIDMSSVKFCNDEMLEKFGRIQLIADYVKSKKMELEDYNKEMHVDESVSVNGRRMTNIGTFRRYMEEYLQSHPKIHNDMTFLVRQLQSTERGIPIEIYVFSNDQAWANYESIQSDIFDHILAIMPEFELRVFQNPTGNDFKSLSSEN